MNVISKLDWRNAAIIFIITITVKYQRNYMYIYPFTAPVSYQWPYTSFWNWLTADNRVLLIQEVNCKCRLCSLFHKPDPESGMIFSYHSIRPSRSSPRGLSKVRHPRTVRQSLAWSVHVLLIHYKQRPWHWLKRFSDESGSACSIHAKDAGV